MTDGEKMVWAVVYAAELKSEQPMGVSGMSVMTYRHLHAMAEATRAVIELRKVYQHPLKMDEKTYDCMMEMLR